MAQTLRNAGVTPTRLLEPSAGTGAFLLPFCEAAPACAFTCFEKDLLTGKILSRLFPDCKVRIEGYEKIEEKYNGYFDVAASNIPFGDVAVFDPLLSNHKNPAARQSAKAVHNYFFVKSLQTVREGGIITFITSQGVLNFESNRPVREFMMQHCRVVSAVRLPNNLFTDYAGTEVGSDLIILQKRTTGGELSVTVFYRSRRLPNGISVSNLFGNFDRVVHTESKMDTDPYGQPAIVFTHAGGVEGIAADLRGILAEDFSRWLDTDYYRLHAPGTTVKPAPQPTVTPQSQPAIQINRPAPVTNSPQPSATATAEPVPTMYDLMGFSAAERSQVNPRFRKKFFKKSAKTKKETEQPKDWRERIRETPQIPTTIKPEAVPAHPIEPVVMTPPQVVSEQPTMREDPMTPAPFPVSDDGFPKHYREGSLVADA